MYGLISSLQKKKNKNTNVVLEYILLDSKILPTLTLYMMPNYDAISSLFNRLEKTDAVILRAL